MAQIPSLSFKPKHDPVQTSLELIEADLSKSLTINWVASQVGVSPFHFQRKFTQDIGETIAGYIRSRRLETAAKLPLGPERTSLIEIALDCGFQTHSAFTRAFSRHFGMTPKQFTAGGFLYLSDVYGSFGVAATICVCSWARLLRPIDLLSILLAQIYRSSASPRRG